MKKTLFFFGAILITNITIAQIPTNGLIGYWPFTGNANDESGNGYNGVVNGAAITTDKNEVINSAYYFNNSSISLPISLGDIIKSGSFTISLWINNGSTKDLQTIFTLTDGNGFGDVNSVFEFNMGLSGQYNGTNIAWYCGLNGEWIYTPVNLNWHHLVGIYDVSTSTAKLFIDNVFIGQENITANLSSLNPTKILIGNNSSRYFIGKIDDIRIYNRVLTQQEITALYNENEEPTPPTTTNSWQPNGNNIYYDGSGNVGIGTDSPKAKLTVNGPILSTEVKVTIDVSNYPDFVFKPEYKLLTLPEVEQYINEQGHLPGVPKAVDVEEGLNLGEMNAKLLQKIEELTLYTIEQNKKIERQDKKIELQSQELKALTEKVKELATK